MTSWRPYGSEDFKKIGDVVKVIKAGCGSISEIVDRTHLSASEIMRICEYILRDPDLMHDHQLIEAVKEILRHPWAPERFSEGKAPTTTPQFVEDEATAQPMIPLVSEVPSEAELMGKPLGHVIISSDRPARPDSFWITVYNEESGLQLGSIVVAEGPRDERVIGIVDNMEFASRPSSVEQWFEDRMRQDNIIQPSLSYPVEQYAHVRVLARNPPIKAPPRGRWLVRYPTYEDLYVLFRRIPKHFRVLAGFLRGPGGELIPVYFHAQFLLGTEGAHINITGKTGLATKTSYAVFLAHSILSWARDAGERVAVVMFNVKRGDLMWLHRKPRDMNEVRKRIVEWAQAIGMEEHAEIMVKLWEKARAEGVDPLRTSVKYFTYKGDPYYDRNYGLTRPYRYGLWDLADNPWNVITAIYGPEEEIPGPQLNMIYTYFDALHATGREISFDEMRDHFEQYASSRSLPRYSTAPRLRRWHRYVADAIYRRLDGFLRRATRVVVRDRPHGKPIGFSDLEEGMINVIQLFGLDPAEKRLVVNAVLRGLLLGLQKPEDERHVDRVMVFVDELNLYAPKTRSPIKEHVLEIAARGRDLGLSLCGAQQFASQIDPQVYGNCSTKVIGNTDPAEISAEIYRFLGNFRSAVPYLEKGEMIVYHPLYVSPIPILFPVPLYKVMEEIRRMS